MTSLWVLLLSLHQASFDCRKASHPVEKQICSDQILSELDDSLAAGWKHLLKEFSGPDQLALKANQKFWNSQIRAHTPPPAELQGAWRERLKDFSVLSRASDLRTLYDKKLPAAGIVQLGRDGNCMGVPDENGELVLHPTTDNLTMQWLPETGKLRFNVTSNVEQHMCNVCQVEGYATLTSDRSSSLPETSTWRWRSVTPEDPFLLQIRLFRDRAVVRFFNSGAGEFCGIGAGFPDSLVFRAVTARPATQVFDPH
ncbi:MAG: hypothetical protein AAB214_10715 [Fibrobacterota bacterium]